MTAVVPVRKSGRSRVAVLVATRCADLAVHECLDDPLEVAFWEVDLAVCMRPKPGFRGVGPLASVLSVSIAAGGAVSTLVIEPAMTVEGSQTMQATIGRVILRRRDRRLSARRSAAEPTRTGALSRPANRSRGPSPAS